MNMSVDIDVKSLQIDVFTDRKGYHYKNEYITRKVQSIKEINTR